MSTTTSRPPAPTIFIGNIPYDLTEEALIEIFQEVGPVKSFRLVNDRDTGMAKGYGFCEYYDTTTAESAVRNLNNHEINGRSIRVDFADEHVTKPTTPKISTDRDRNKEELPAKEMPVGMEAVKRAACKMAFLLGGRDVVLSNVPPSTGTNLQIYAMLAEMRRKEMYDLLAGMKEVVQRNYSHAKTLLIQNPQLSRTLFLIEILLGVVDAPELPDSARDGFHDYDDRTGMSQHRSLFQNARPSDGVSASNFSPLVINPPPPPMQALGMYESNMPSQQPMTNYQSVVHVPTMFAPSNLPGLNLQNVGIVAGNQTPMWQGSTTGLVGGMGYGGQEQTPMMAQNFGGMLPGMQVLSQQGGQSLIHGMLGSNQVLVNPSMIPQPMIPVGNLRHTSNDMEMEQSAQQMTIAPSSEGETIIPGDALDEQTKSQLHQILSLTEEQLAALPPEHRDQAIAIQRQFGKIS